MQGREGMRQEEKGCGGARERETRGGEIKAPWEEKIKQRQRLSLDGASSSSSQVCDEVQSPRLVQEGISRAAGEHTDDHSRLPWHLILKCLPVRKLCQLRCVSKAWNVMLGGVLSPAGDPLIVAEKEHLFVMVRPKDHLKSWDVLAYSSQSRSFFPLPLPNCSHRKLCSLLGRHGSHLVRSPEAWRFVLAEAGGLICVFVHGIDASYVFSLVVFNCLTGSLKVLPRSLDAIQLFGHDKPSPCNISMTLDCQDSSRYYIMLTHGLIAILCYGVSPLYFEVFDSKEDCWKVGCSLDLATANSTGLTVWDGDFFFVFDPADVGATTMPFTAYHVAHDVWSSVQVPVSICASVIPSYTPLKFRRRLLMGNVFNYSGEDHIFHGFGVWELQSTSSKTATWVEVARTPPQFWTTLCNQDWCCDLSAGGSFFYMVFKRRERTGGFCIKAGHNRPALVYDVAQDLWYSLPSEGCTSEFDCILVHQPKLSARA